MPHPLPLEIQTLYAELMEQLAAAAAHRSIGHLSGTFVTKRTANDTYYYFQYSVPGGTSQQMYLGKQSPALDALVARFKAEKERWQPDLARIRLLCAQLRIGGALVTDTASARVLRALADGGLFYQHAVLVGTHAFTVLGNLLGVRWQHAALRTHDIDLAGAAHLTIAMPSTQTDVPTILDELQMGFLPVPSFNLKDASTSFKVRGQALRVDFLTPGRRTANARPIHLARFNVAAQPLPYLDYLIEQTEPGAILNGGGIFVNVPTPARFALHKMIIAQERNLASHDKVAKDLLQAAQLLTVLAESRPGDVELAWTAIQQRGTGWTRKCRAGWARMRKLWPEYTADPHLQELLG